MVNKTFYYLFRLLLRFLLFLNDLFQPRQVLRRINLSIQSKKFISSNNEDSALIKPKNLAIIFVDKTLNCISDLIEHSLNHSIPRITFYDPWSNLYSNRHELKNFVANNLKHLNGRLLFDEKKKSDKENYLQINILGEIHGRAGLVKVCRQLCKSGEEITPSSIKSYLEKDGIFETDFLVKIGSAPFCLAGFSPFNLRITEFLSISKFEDKESVSKVEFDNLLRRFSNRDRRQGR